MYSVNLVLELSLSFTKIGLADQFLEITLPCWKSSLRGRSRRFEKESPRSISWRKKGCCAIGRGGVKVVSAIGRGRVKGVSASELLPCRCLIKMPSNSFMIFTFSASHQKFYFKGLIEEGSNRASPTIKGRSSIPTHTFNFCDTCDTDIPGTSTHGGVMGVLRSVVRHSGLCHVTWWCDVTRSRLAQSLW